MVAAGDKLSGGLHGIKFFCPIFVKSEGRQNKPREYESPGVSYLERFELLIVLLWRLVVTVSPLERGEGVC